MVYVVKELKNGTSTESKTSITALEERTVDQEPVVYENKLVYDWPYPFAEISYPRDYFLSKL